MRNSLSWRSSRLAGGAVDWRATGGGEGARRRSDVSPSCPHLDSGQLCSLDCSLFASCECSASALEPWRGAHPASSADAPFLCPLTAPHSSRSHSSPPSRPHLRRSRTHLSPARRRGTPIGRGDDALGHPLKPPEPLTTLLKQETIVKQELSTDRAGTSAREHARVRWQL